MTVFAKEWRKPHLLAGGAAAERNGRPVGQLRQDERGGFLCGVENGGFKMAAPERGGSLFEHFHHRTFLPVLNVSSLYQQTEGEKSIF